MGTALLPAHQALILSHHRHLPIPGEGHHLADADPTGLPPRKGVLEGFGANKGDIHQLSRAAEALQAEAEG